MKKIRILCYGDSNTYGYDPRTGLRYPKEIRWTGVLARELGPGFEVIEEGCNGRTTVFQEPDAPWKAGDTSLMAVLNSHKPLDLVILMLGSNDLKEMFHAEAATIAAGAERLVQMIQAFGRMKQTSGPKILLASPITVGPGMVDTSSFRDSFAPSSIVRSQQFCQYYRNIADRYGCIFVNAADYAGPSPVDSLHMDPEDHLSLGKAFADVVKRAFCENDRAHAAEEPGMTVQQVEEADQPEGAGERSVGNSAACGASMEQLRKIIARLRDPETGCRWDKAQTHDSVKGCCVEEAAEVIAGINILNETGNPDNLKEELGDLLMQVVLHAQMAEEAGLFSLTDVIDGISRKMIRRHPHVFHTGDAQNGDLEDMIRENQARDKDGNLLTSWAEIKAQEKEGKIDANSYLPGALCEAEELIGAARERKGIGKVV